MLKGIKVRLFPTQEQEILFWQKVNAARFVYNWGLAKQMERFNNKEKYLSAYELRNELRNLVKTDEAFSWLKSLGASILVTPLFDLDKAYQRFFDFIKTDKPKFSKVKLAKLARKNKKPTNYDMQNHPKFKSKRRAKISFPVRNDRTTFKEKANIKLVTLECCGKVKFQTDLDFTKWTQVYNPRVTFENGKWILSFSTEVENQDIKLGDYCVGVDVGIKTLAVVNSGIQTVKIKNINKSGKVKSAEKRHKRLQRQISRRQDNSKNKAKAQAKANELKRHIKNIRNNHTHNATRQIVNLLPKRIGIETLNIQGMLKNHHLAKAIQDASLSEFIRQLEYKSAALGIETVKADRWFPSTKKCSCCGHLKRDLKLRDRAYVCLNCGLHIDRDKNAAINLRILAESQ